MIEKILSINHNVIVFYFYKWKIISSVTWSTISFLYKTKILFTPWKLGLINKSKYRFSCCTVTFGSDLFRLINWSNSFALSWVDKFTIGTSLFVSVVVNVGSWPAIGLSIVKHLLDQFGIRLISQLINDVLRVLQKLLKCFDSTLIVTFFVSSSSSSILPAIFVLILNEALLLSSAGKLAIAPLAFKNGSSL